MPLRADASRNRVQVIDTARAAFAMDGTDVSMAELARRAGVGLATLLRRFPTKGALLEAVLEPMFLQFEATMESVAASSDDPWGALAIPLRELCRLQAAEPGLSTALARSLSDAAPTETCTRIGGRMQALLDEAQRQDLVRADATMDDIVLIALSVAGVLSGMPSRRQRAANRVVDLLLEALKGPTAKPRC